MSIKNLVYLEKEVGRTIHSSKIQYVWECDIDGKHIKIDFYDSKFSGKKKLITNGHLECEMNSQPNFFRNFTIDSHNFTLIQTDEVNELRINNQSFSYLYNLEKNQKHYSKEAGPISRSYKVKTPMESKSNKFDINNNFYANTNSAGRKEDKPKLFNFNIKPNDITTEQQKQFKFNTNVLKESVSNENEKNDLLGLNQQVQSDIEDGNKNSNESNLKDLLDIFNCNTEQQQHEEVKQYTEKQNITDPNPIMNYYDQMNYNYPIQEISPLDSMYNNNQFISNQQHINLPYQPDEQVYEQNKMIYSSFPNLYQN